MRVLSEDGPEERGAGRQDEFVCLDLSGTTAQGAIEEIFLLSYFPEGNTDVALKIIPAEAKLLAGSHLAVYLSINNIKTRKKTFGIQLRFRSSCFQR